MNLRVVFLVWCFLIVVLPSILLIAGGEEKRKEEEEEDECHVRLMERTCTALCDDVDSADVAWLGPTHVFKFCD